MARHRRALVWFRRDLRITDQRALDEALASAEEIVPVYCLSDWKGAHRWTGPKRQHFLCGCLASLASNIEALGGEMVFRQGEADQVLAELVAETGATALFYNRDYDPFGRKMEKRVQEVLAGERVEIRSFKDTVLHERDELLTGAGGPYRVFTPYSKSWFAAEKIAPAQAPRKISSPKGLASLGAPTLAAWSLPETSTGQILEAGEKAARARMKALHQKSSVLGDYQRKRDIPAGQTTSRLSQDLRFGLISPRELFARSMAFKESLSSAGKREGVHTFLKEVAWRDFYQQILWHFPEVLEEEFNPVWRGLPWEYNERAFSAWTEGRTGFPIVDAGMRELSSTGFMHNRVRMIVSMFLTKDLHIDWRWGERYFMEQLVDGDIASNNGGWQWSAGTGADAAPYFRIQNPWTQSKRYDPKGEYIRHWIPELEGADSAGLHLAPTEGESVWMGYPAPIVDHARERNRTLETFKRHREERGV